MNREQKERLIEKIEYDIKSDMIAQEEKKKRNQVLSEIKQLLEDALDVGKTNAEQSFDNFYKAIRLCELEINNKPMTATEAEQSKEKIDKAYEAMCDWAKYFLEKIKQEKK